MGVIFTNHARQRMKLRGITLAMVKIAIKNPDNIGFGYGMKSLVFKKFNGKTIKVVFVQKKDTRVIISVIWE